MSEGIQTRNAASHGRRRLRLMGAACASTALALALGLAGCASPTPEEVAGDEAMEEALDDSRPIMDKEAIDTEEVDQQATDAAAQEAEAASQAEAKPEPATPTIEIAQSLRPDLSHGSKTGEYQKYIVLHDTEGGGSPYDVIDGWESDGNYIASHFIVGRDGEVVQVVPMDEIAHHAGFGDAGHNDFYGTTDESRDDRRGTTPIGDWAPDYGMNSYSIGIEMIHRGGVGEDYPEAQLEALDALIAYIDDYYGTESQIIDHKAWRSYNSDTSPEFAGYLESYQTTRTHDGA